MNPQTPSRHHRLQLPKAGDVQVYIFDHAEQGPITAVVFGDLTAVSAPLVRIHSRCLYGEVLGSLDCDCRAQLELATDLLTDEPGGVLIYLEQEGRGCGLLSKAAAYELNDREGLDTVDAYVELGLAIDARSYIGAAEAIRRLGIREVRLLTNNPAKVSDLVSHGIAVTREPLITSPTVQNLQYLKAKQCKLGHDLRIDDITVRSRGH